MSKADMDLMNDAIDRFPEITQLKAFRNILGPLLRALIFRVRDQFPSALSSGFAPDKLKELEFNNSMHAWQLKFEKGFLFNVFPIGKEPSRWPCVQTKTHYTPDLSECNMMLTGAHAESNLHQLVDTVYIRALENGIRDRDFRCGKGIENCDNPPHLIVPKSPVQHKRKRRSGRNDRRSYKRGRKPDR